MRQDNGQTEDLESYDLAQLSQTILTFLTSRCAAEVADMVTSIGSCWCLHACAVLFCK